MLFFLTLAFCICSLYGRFSDTSTWELLCGNFTVECGEFSGRPASCSGGSSRDGQGINGVGKGEGPSIVYMPTRKETETLAKFLCKHGVLAAAYHAKVKYLDDHLT